MVAVAAPAKVLVTGANGYLAAWAVKKYLEEGYAVRGTVRSVTKSAFLNDIFAEYGDRFELVVVEDITKEGAFDEAVKGVSAIAHTASPFHYNGTEPDELITPAVKGTTSILNSALKHGSTVKRVIVTSSIAAILKSTMSTTTQTYTEEDWNDPAVEDVKVKRKEAGPLVFYFASKTLAERAAWDFVSAHQSEISWDLCVINPPWIFGPSLGPAPNIDDINTSQREIYNALVGAKTGPQLVGNGSWVEVGDCAEAHVRATYTPAAGGERIVIHEGSFYFQDICEACLDAAAELGITNVSRGEPGCQKNVPLRFVFDTTKAERVLGMTQMITLKDMVTASVKDFQARGYPGFTA
ncbi:D-lactaldehyde dehydrogenase [Gloeopeniophorella convolvens]|nr:D-lactaldehyde dehydrogenase [Gloeopeniophorella convolvens]